MYCFVSSRILVKRLEQMRRRNSSNGRSISASGKWRVKLALLLLLLFCIGSFFLMQNQYSQVIRLAAQAPAVQKPKIAFLFIARNRLPLDMVWDAFFKVAFLVRLYCIVSFILKLVDEES